MRKLIYENDNDSLVDDSASYKVHMQRLQKLYAYIEEKKIYGKLYGNYMEEMKLKPEHKLLLTK